MKQTIAHLTAALALTFALAACVPKPRPAPPAVTRPAPIATPAPAPPPPVANWQDAPQTPGDWRYVHTADRSLASFGRSDAQIEFVLACIAGDQKIMLTRYGNTMSTMTIRAETAARTLATMAASDRQGVTAALAANDRLLDAMALSKGRFAVEARGTPTLYLPAWAEVTRVIEDCR